MASDWFNSFKTQRNSLGILLEIESNRTEGAEESLLFRFRLVNSATCLLAHLSCAHMRFAPSLSRRGIRP